MLVLIDDFSAEIYRSNTVVQLCIRLSTKEKMDLMMTCHLALGRTLGPNYQIVLESLSQMFLLRSLNDQTALPYLGRRFFPQKPDHLQECLNAASEIMQQPQCYIALDCDLSKKIQYRSRVSTNLFNENPSLPPVYFQNPIVTKK